MVKKTHLTFRIPDELLAKIDAIRPRSNPDATRTLKVIALLKMALHELKTRRGEDTPSESE